MTLNNLSEDTKARFLYTAIQLAPDTNIKRASNKKYVTVMDQAQNRQAFSVTVSHSIVTFFIIFLTHIQLMVLWAHISNMNHSWTEVPGCLGNFILPKKIGAVFDDNPSKTHCIFG